MPNAVNLSGSVNDDGLPIAGILTTTWSKVSGPGAVTFADFSSPSTTATFSEVGTYTLELLANDSELSSSDTTTIIVNEPAGPTEVTETFSSRINHKHPTRSFSVNVAEGPTTAALTFNSGKGKKGGNTSLTLKVYNSQNQLVGEALGSSPVTVSNDMLAGNYTYEVSGSRVSFTLQITYLSP